MNTNINPKHTISGRKLHKHLQVSTYYTTWFSTVVSRYLIEGEDYTQVRTTNPDTGSTIRDHMVAPEAIKRVKLQQAVYAKPEIPTHSAIRKSETVSTEIVTNINGEPRASSLDIAEFSAVQHKNVLDLVETHYESLESFGHLAFQTRDRKGKPGPVLRYALLNEPQATLLMTFMRNTKKVIEFKRELVKQFYEMRKSLTGPELPTGHKLIALAIIEAQVLLQKQDEVIAVQEAEIKVLTPLATQARTFNTAKGNVGRQDFARDIVAWASEEEGVRVTATQVHTFMSESLGFFISKTRKAGGEATLKAVRQGYATTKYGVSKHNGYAYGQGVLTPKGVEYAWKRIAEYIEDNGTLKLNLVAQV